MMSFNFIDCITRLTVPPRRRITHRTIKGVKTFAIDKKVYRERSKNIITRSINKMKC